MLSKQRAPCRLRLATWSPQGAGLDYPKEDEMVVRSAIAVVRLVEEDDRQVRPLIGIGGKLITNIQVIQATTRLGSSWARANNAELLVLVPRILPWGVKRQHVPAQVLRMAARPRTDPDLFTKHTVAANAVPRLVWMQLCSGSCQDCSDSTRNTATAASRHAAGNTGNT